MLTKLIPLLRFLFTKTMRSVKDYACYAKTPEFRVIPTSVITVINENNSITLTLT